MPKAKYFLHCRSHTSLNLVSKVPVMKNFTAILGKITWFLCGSSKRKNIMKDIFKEAGTTDLRFDMLCDEFHLFEHEMK